VKRPPRFVCGLAIVGCSLVAGVAASAQPAGGKAAEAPGAEAPASTTNALIVNLPPGERDPFWPVGYVPPPPAPPAPTNQVGDVDAPKPEEVIEWPNLVVKGITRNKAGRYMAVIDGIGLVESGETVATVREGFRFRWIILAVTNQGVLQRKLDVVRVK
jgi:hypothetical protein